MKTPIIIALFAVAASAATAGAQTTEKLPLPSQPRTLKDSLRQNSYLPDSTRSAGVLLFATPGAQNSKSLMTIVITRQDGEQALRQLAHIFGAAIVIDPAIRFRPAQTRTIQFSDVKDDVFGDLSDYLIRGEAIEKWKSASGTYFFAALPGVTEAITRDEQENARQEHLKKEQLPTGLFDLPSIKLIPENQRPTPQPGWEKREFNGHEFFFIPAPGAAK